MKNDKNRIQKIMYYPQPTRVYYLVYTAGNGINGGWTEYPAAEYPQLADLVGNPDATDDDFYRYTYDNNGAPYIKNADDSVIQRYKEECRPCTAEEAEKAQEYIDSVKAEKAAELARQHRELRKKDRENERIKERIDINPDNIAALSGGINYLDLFVIYDTPDLSPDYSIVDESLAKKADVIPADDYIHLRIIDLRRRLAAERKKPHTMIYRDVTGYGCGEIVAEKAVPTDYEHYLSSKIRQLKNRMHRPEEYAEIKKKQDRGYQTAKSIIQRGLSFEGEYFCTFTASGTDLHYDPAIFLDYVASYLKKRGIKFVLVAEPFLNEYNKKGTGVQYNVHDHGKIEWCHGKVYDYWAPYDWHEECSRGTGWHLHAITDKPVDMDEYNLLIMCRHMEQMLAIDYPGHKLDKKDVMSYYEWVDDSATQVLIDKKYPYNPDYADRKALAITDWISKWMPEQEHNTYCEPLYNQNIKGYTDADGRKRALKYITKHVTRSKEMLGTGVRVYRSNIPVVKAAHERHLVLDDGTSMLLYDNKAARIARIKDNKRCRKERIARIKDNKRCRKERIARIKEYKEHLEGIYRRNSSVKRKAALIIDKKTACGSDTGVYIAPILSCTRLLYDISSWMIRYLAWIEHIPDG